MQNRPNGDVGGITRVVGSTAPVYDVTEWTTGKDINAKDALVSLTNYQMAGRFSDSLTIRKFETFQTLGNERGQT